MVRKEISPVWLIGAAVILLGMVGFWLFRATGPAVPPASSYTPGVPPWLAKNGSQEQAGVHNAPSAPKGR